eukprot:1258255-Rhodomonas_salina.2
MGARFISARARATRCRCPPGSTTPTLSTALSVPVRKASAAPYPPSVLHFPYQLRASVPDSPSRIGSTIAYRRTRLSVAA